MPIHYLRVHVRSAPGAGTSSFRNLLPPPDPIARFYQHTIRLKMRVSCKAPLAEIEHHSVAAFAFRSQVLPRFIDSQVRIASDRDYNRCIGYRKHRLTEGGKAR